MFKQREILSGNVRVIPMTHGCTSSDHVQRGSSSFFAMQFKFITLIAPVCLLVACGGGGSSSSSSASNELVFRESQVLEEGATYSWTLPAGTYKANVTSSSSGVVVSWVGGGAGCTQSGEVKVHSQTCTLVIAGQLLVKNPTTFGLGSSEIASVEVFRQ